MLAQLDARVGDIEGNVKKILEAHRRAQDEGASLLVTPELSVVGYPPQDLLDRPEIPRRSEAAIEALLRETKDSLLPLVVGAVTQNSEASGKRLQNTLLVLGGGKILHRQAKVFLPTYDVFDEARYFAPGKDVHPWEWKLSGEKSIRVGFLICEDVWGGLKIPGNPELLIAISASPYEWGKMELREKVHKKIAISHRAPLLSLNQVGANDSILFDGRSFGMNAEGTLQGVLPVFEECTGVATLDGKVDSASRSASEIETVAKGLILGIQDYFQKTGFRKAVIGLSGGIDSAVVAVLATQALGKKNVHGIGMPGPFSSSKSLEDAEELARNLGISFESRPIKFVYTQLARELGEARQGLSTLARENLQSRIRGLTLMTVSNDSGALVLCTANKSEIAMGYGTQYGDLIGALAPLGDLYKTRVYELANALQKIYSSPIPLRSIERAPSAELAPDQKDQDSLPPYPLLDDFLADLLENALPIEEIEHKHDPLLPKPHRSRTLFARLESNEYKRLQAPPVLRVTNKAFGIGRRIPVSKALTSSAFTGTLIPRGDLR